MSVFVARTDRQARAQVVAARALGAAAQAARGARGLLGRLLASSIVRRGAFVTVGTWGVLLLGSACGTVDPGEDFQVAEIVFDENYYYCKVEPVLFAQGCGTGDPGQDPSGGCHFVVTNFKLEPYDPKVSDSCNGNTPTSAIPQSARANYQNAQRQMRVNSDQAPLFTHPTKKTAHPRQIFPPDSPEADVIRNWAERFSSQ